jgi:excisionase family DNA binding protein
MTDTVDTERECMKAGAVAAERERMKASAYANGRERMKVGTDATERKRMKVGDVATERERVEVGTTDAERECMKADELAKFLGVNRKTVYAYALRGAIPHRRMGRRIVFSRSQVVSWLGHCDMGAVRKGIQRCL